jgi:hypothetical protein
MLQLAAQSASAFLLSLTLLSPLALVNALPYPNGTIHISEDSSSSFWNQGSKLGAAWPDGDASYLSNLRGINKYVLHTGLFSLFLIRRLECIHGLNLVLEKPPNLVLLVFLNYGDGGMQLRSKR